MVETHVRNRRRRWLFRLGVIGLVWLGSASWQMLKPLPDGVGVTGVWRSADAAAFVADRTFVDAAGTRHSEQAIFDAAFTMIAGAQRLIVLDMFLFNDFGNAGGSALRPLSGELTTALLARKAAIPELRVIVVTDPINTVYGGMQAIHLQRLQAAGVQLIVTDLSVLRASNPLWSGPWGLCCAWLGNSAEGGWLPNPFGEEKISLRSWLALPNFRANHRKTLVTDAGDTWQALVTSANPHDASSAHGNVALRFSGDAALDVIATEAAVAAFSAAPLDGLPMSTSTGEMRDARLRVLTEGAIGRALVATIDGAVAGEALDVAVFYLSDRDVVRALQRARARDVALRVLLDPNEDAFGRKKNGVPNRQVARELVDAGVSVRWCDTHGEQCHAKLLLHRGQRQSTLIVGSANFTRRNLDDLNLETSVQLIAGIDGHAAVTEATRWFESQWNNEADRHYSVDYARYADDAWSRRAWYRVGEALGLSTW